MVQAFLSGDKLRNKVMVEKLDMKCGKPIGADTLRYALWRNNMGKNTSRTLNEMLVKLFDSIMDMEEKAVITKEFEDITNNDMHILEAIGNDEPRSMSVIAKRMDVTVSTLTTNMNSLENKGYIVRERSRTDKRVVLVSLTDKGKKAFYHHRDFHKNMIKAIIKDLDEDEMKVLIKSLLNLDGFFNNGNEKE